MHPIILPISTEIFSSAMENGSSTIGMLIKPTFLVIFAYQKTNMKYKLTLIAAFIGVAIGVTAQNTDKTLVKNKKSIFTIVPIEAELPGGKQAWSDYIEKNLNNSLSSLDNAPAGNYSVEVSYIIDIHGKIKKVIAENNPGYGTAEEAVRVISSYPKTSPATQDGKPIVFEGKQTIIFVVTDDSSSNNDNHKPIVKNSNKSSNYPKVFTSVQIETEYPGGMHAWAKYLERNLNNSIPKSKGAPDGKYTVILNFYVNGDGKIGDVYVENDPGYGTAQEAIRVIKNLQNWKPAVRHWARQEITFVVTR